MHVAFGTSCFIGAMLAAVSGLLEKAIWSLKDDYKEFTIEGVVVNLIGVFIALYGILVLYLVNHDDFKRTALTDDQIGLDRSD